MKVGVNVGNVRNKAMIHYMLNLWQGQGRVQWSAVGGVRFIDSNERTLLGQFGFGARAVNAACHASTRGFRLYIVY